jgi:membrane-associated phospholipid phosphatase
VSRRPRIPLAAEEAAPLGLAAPPQRVVLSAPRRRRTLLVFLADWLPMVALLAAYELLRDLVPLVGARAHDLVGIERGLFGGREPTLILQAALYRPDRIGVLDVAGSAAYFMHFVLPVAVGVYLWRGERSRYRAFAASLLVACCLAFVTYVAFPTQPPWLGHPQAVHKVIDETIGKLHLPGWLVGFYRNRDYNVDAAFPSLHAAFPLIATLHVWPRSRRLGIFLAAWTVVVWLAVVYLGEHYVIDVLGGVGYATAAVLAVAWWRRRDAGRRVAPVGS